MKRYIVEIEYMNGRRNQIVWWAENEDQAKKRALKCWRATIYKSLTAVEIADNDKHC